MSRYSLTHLADDALLRDLTALVTTDRATTALLLAHLAEADRRRLYAKKSCDSLFEYCVRELRLSEDCAKKRIRAARTARAFPSIFAALGDGRLSLTAVLILSRHLTRRNACELLAAAEHRSNAELEVLLAERFPQADLPTVLVPLVAVAAPGAPTRPVPATCWHSAGSGDEGAARPLDSWQAASPQEIAPETPDTATARPEVSSTGLVQTTAPPPSALVPAPAMQIGKHSATTPTLAPPAMPPARVIMLSPHRVGLQFTVSRATHDKLRRVQDLLGHAVPSGDMAEVFDRALDALIHKLERRKFGATDRPRAAKAPRSGNPRTIPNDVRRAVVKRDGRRCTYVGSGGRRCESRKRLEFDHVVPVAHGGQATLSNLRLRCRAHNQLEADQVFGAEHMQARREQAQRAAALDREARQRAAKSTPSSAPWLSTTSTLTGASQRTRRSCLAGRQASSSCGVYWPGTPRPRCASAFGDRATPRAAFRTDKFR